MLLEIHYYIHVLASYSPGIIFRHLYAIWEAQTSLEGWIWRNHITNQSSK